MSQTDVVRQISRAVKELRSDDGDTCIRGIHRLYAIRRRHFTKLLLPLLDHPAKNVRWMAAQCLESDESCASRELQRRAISAEDKHMRWSCLLSLREMAGSAAHRAFVKALDDPAADVVQMACAALGEQKDPRATRHIVRLLDSAEWYTRFSACVSLIMLRWKNPKLVSAVRNLMDSPEGQEHDRRVAELSSEIIKDKLSGGKVFEHDCRAFRPLAEILAEAERLLLD